MKKQKYKIAVVVNDQLYVDKDVFKTINISDEDKNLIKCFLTRWQKKDMFYLSLCSLCENFYIDGSELYKQYLSCKGRFPTIIPSYEFYHEDYAKVVADKFMGDMLKEEKWRNNKFCLGRTKGYAQFTFYIERKY